MGALDMGLTEDELQPLVDMWRSSNPRITAYWWAVDAAVKDAIKQRTQTQVGGITFVMKNGMLFITLPSGRRLAYVKPRIGENRFGGESVTYMGIDAQKKWNRIESYGPKFVENITARSLGMSMMNSSSNATRRYRWMRSVSRWGGPLRGYLASSLGLMGTSADFIKKNKKNGQRLPLMVSTALNSFTVVFV